jgi:hypothetical protein
MREEMIRMISMNFLILCNISMCNYVILVCCPNAIKFIMLLLIDFDLNSHVDNYNACTLLLRSLIVYLSPRAIKTSSNDDCESKN